MAFKRRRFRRKGGKSLASRMKRLENKVNKVRRNIQPEIKAATATLVPTLVADNGAPTFNYFVLAQGVGSNNRIGTQVRYIGFEINWLVRNTYTTSPQAGVLAFVVDRMVNGTAPAAGQLLQSTGIYSYKSPYNVDQVGGRYCPYAAKALGNRGADMHKRFHVVKEARLELPPLSATGQGSKNYTRGTWRLGSDFVQTYQGSAGTVADIVDKLPYLVVWGQNDGAGPSVNGFVYEYNITGFFIDE